MSITSPMFEVLLEDDRLMFPNHFKKRVRVRMKSPQLSSLRNIVPMKPWLARCAFFLGLFLVGSFWTHRGSSAEFDRIGIVSAFDPELMAIEQAIIPKKAENK